MKQLHRRLAALERTQAAQGAAGLELTPAAAEEALSELLQWVQGQAAAGVEVPDDYYDRARARLGRLTR